MIPAIIVVMRRSAFLHEYGSRRAIDTYQRLGRWGTCSACPINGDTVHTEACVYTDRSDHHLTLEDLTEQYTFWKRRNGLQ